METLIDNKELAAFTARVFLGLLFIFQGYDAMFALGLKTVSDTFQADFGRKGIPRLLTAATVWCTAFSELIGGGFLILGIFRDYTMLVMCFNLLIAAIGFGIITPIWDLRYVFPRLALLVFLLVIPPDWDTCNLDHIFFNQP